MRTAIRRVAAALGVLALAFVTLTLPAAAPASAAPTQPFTVKFSTNANGALTTVGNNLLTCSASSSCTNAQNGAATDNNGFTMTQLDADGMPGTTNSSASRLDLPEGATVLWAGLYWGARLDAGSGGQSASASAIGGMSLRAPGDTGYRTVAASTATHDQFGPNTSSYGAYQRFADVTTIVRSAGNGSYWGANVAAATGQDRYAGWALTVAYSAPGLPLRNLTVFDGFDVVSNRSPQSVQVSGFLAPRSGTVDAQLTMVAYEGDLSQTGDYTRLDSTQLATAASPGSNFFDSTNDSNGSSVATRTPAHRNMLGFDVKNLGASGVIPNGATSATFTFSSNGDVYYPGVVGLAINLYAPDFTASAKTVVNLSGHSPARPGDTLEYTVHYSNTGQDPAVDAVSEDDLPPGTSYVPGSLRYLASPVSPPGELTDGAGDDRGEVDGRTVRVRVGTGATASAGGTVDIGAAPAYAFQVTLDDDAGGTTVANLANLDYATATTGTAARYTTQPATVDVARQADVSVTKTMSPDPAAVGQDVTATLVVRNDGPNAATDVTVTDPVPAGWDGVTATSTAGTCSVAEGTVSCALGDLADGATATVTLTGTTSSGSTATSLTNVATVSTSSLDPTPANNVSGATVTLARRADLSVTKTPSPTTAGPGAETTWTLRVSNAGPSDARAVRITDALDDAGRATLTGATITSADGSAPACEEPTGRGATCTLDRLPAGATATVTVTGTLATNLTAGATVANTATVSSATPDPATDDNTATATVTASAPEADVRVTKAGPADVVAGRSIAWTVTATNYGPADATGVVVTDAVPDGVTGVGATTSRGDACTVEVRTVTCPVGALPSAGAGTAGAAVTITVTGLVAPGATGTLRNTATATSTSTDPAGGNDTATSDTAVRAEYDLAVTKTANRTTLPGEAPRPVDYRITITNNGPSAARDIDVSDALPDALDLRGADPVTGCAADVTADGFTCTVPGPVAPGETAVVTVAMQADEVLAGGPDVVQTVTIDAPGDTDPSNDEASWTLSGLPFVDLSLAKTADATVTAGGTTTYDLVVTNTNDPGDVTENLAALRPVLTDTLPDGMTFQGATVTSGGGQSVTCGTSGQTLTCQLGANLDAGTSATVEVTVDVAPDVAAGATLVNAATVVTGNMETNPDNNLANNSAQASSTVDAEADVAVTGLSVEPVDPEATGPGTHRRVHLTVSNEGPSVARDVTLRIERTEDGVLVDPGTLPADCTATAREIVCTLDGRDLAPGESVDIDYVLEVASYVDPGTYVKTAQAASSTPETDLTNNTQQASTVVGTPVTDLAVTKTATGTVPNPDEASDPHDSFVAGGAFTYRIEVAVAEAARPGAGYADAQDVVVEDLLPLGFVATGASTGSGTCTITPAVEPGGGVRSALSCSLGTVHGWSGATAPAPVVVTVHGTLDPDANNLNGGDRFAEQVPNTATATTGTPLAGGATSVQDAAAVDVVEIADLHLVKTPDAATVNAGGTVGYTLTVVNSGASGVEHAVVTDSLPAGFTLVDALSECTPPQTTPVDETEARPQVPDGPGQEIACRLGAVPAGGSATIHVVASTPDTLAAGTATNTATVGLLANEAAPDDNTATADVDVRRVTNLGISASASTLTPAAGQDVTFTGFAVNNGPSTADGTNGDTVFPPGFVPYADSVDVPFNDCTWNRTPPDDPTTASWEDFRYVLHCEPLTPGARWEAGGATTNVVTVHVPGDTPAGSYSGRAVIRSDTPETTEEDNEAPLTLTVQHVSDTSLVKDLVDPHPMVAGSPATWRLTMRNAGPSVAEDVVVSDTVPGGMTFVSAELEGGADCPVPETHGLPNGDTETIVRCPVGRIPVGESASVLVTFDVAADQVGENLCNSALVGSGSLDPAAVDNEGESCGEVAAPPGTDVSLVLSPPTQTHLSGERAELTATVRNEGPDDATDVVAVLDVPPGLTDYSGVAVSWPAGRPQPPDGVVGSLTLDVGDLAPGEEVVYRVVGTATGSPGDVLPVDGVVTHEEPDTVEPNDTDEARILIVEPDVSPSPSPSPSGAPSVPPSPGPTSGAPAVPPGPGEPGGTTTAPPSTSGPLPVTGAQVAGWAIAALVVTGVGLALLAAARRRREG
ncbi:hypothetical protein ACFQ8T_11055 [Isoptericola sp. NPDC056618]|uniref:hypothetical protein n=1 Tax=Isoptericola sp. NPDC056618 TaxID=3345878 RepID=UPI0036A064A1